MMQTTFRFAAWAAAASLAASAAAQTPGTWTLYPPQSAIYQTSVHQPINADGSSHFNANRGVIPVKFSLAAGVGPARFESILSDSYSGNDYSFLRYVPASPITLADLSHLSVDYAFSLGNNTGGSLRWQVRIDANGSGVEDAADGNLFIYYGEMPNFTGTTHSGTNMIGDPDLRFDMTQIGGAFYDSYANAIALHGTHRVFRASLVLDSGWASDQRMGLFENANVNGNIWNAVPGSSPTPTTNLPPATIRVTKIAGSGTGPINEVLSIQPADSDAYYRVVDSKYMYNLDVRALTGTGTYMVEVLIDGSPASNPAYFDLR